MSDADDGLAHFFFQAEDGIRALVRSRGLGDVYKRQLLAEQIGLAFLAEVGLDDARTAAADTRGVGQRDVCLLYTSDAADDLLCVDLGGRRIIQTKNYATTTLTFAP